MIVLGGGVVRSAPWLIDAVREDLEAKAATATFPDYSGMDDRVTVLDDDQRVAAIGAALMGCHDLSTTVGAKV